MTERSGRGVALSPVTRLLLQGWGKQQASANPETWVLLV